VASQPTVGQLVLCVAYWQPLHYTPPRDRIPEPNPLTERLQK